MGSREAGGSKMAATLMIPAPTRSRLVTTNDTIRRFRQLAIKSFGIESCAFISRIAEQ